MTRRTTNGRGPGMGMREQSWRREGLTMQAVTETCQPTMMSSAHSQHPGVRPTLTPVVHVRTDQPAVFADRGAGDRRRDRRVGGLRVVEHRPVGGIHLERVAPRTWRP